MTLATSFPQPARHGGSATRWPRLLWPAAALLAGAAALFAAAIRRPPRKDMAGGCVPHAFHAGRLTSMEMVYGSDAEQYLATDPGLECAPFFERFTYK